MPSRPERSPLRALLLLSLSGLLLGHCSRPPEAAATAEPSPAMTPVSTVKDLMVDLVDPQADAIFEAVAVDITESGIIETKPTSDEDWEKVSRGARLLAEATNLLKLPRRIAPEGDTSNTGGPDAPELSPPEIQAKVDADRTLWDSHADRLREEALGVLEVVKSRDSDRLFEAGSTLDQACESCHLDYWYPGDAEAVLKDRSSRVYTQPADEGPAPK